MFSFIQSLLEPGSAGSAGEAQHSDPGRQQVHISHQVPLHAEHHHSVHQQEQDQQPACVCGRDPTKVPQHEVTFFLFCRGTGVSPHNCDFHLFLFYASVFFSNTGSSV